MSRKRLSRGLSALLDATDSLPVSGEEESVPAGAATPREGAAGRRLLSVNVEDVFRSPHQPRVAIDEAGLDELAASIRAQGLMQPVVVRPRPLGGFELIAGERRWRAAQRAGLAQLEALVCDVDDRRAMAMALIENMQREDLNPLEEALGLKRLLDEFALTQQALADAVGKSRPAVANLVRLLNLSAGVRELLRDGGLEMGHARALLPLPPPQQEALARAVVARGLSVRQTEQLARRAAAPRREAARPAADADTERLQREISEQLGAPVAISHTAKGRGKVVIAYASLDELDGILERLRRS